MDRKTLNKEELLQLKTFIESRSATFAEPAVMLEILDHFACKVEEVLRDEQGIAFRDAVQKAHKSFGVRGFAPIAAAFEKSVLQQYRQWFRKERLKVLLSFHVIGMILLGLFFAEAFMLLRQADWLGLGGREVVFMMEVIYAIYIYPQRLMNKSFRKHRLFFEKSLEVSGSMLFWVFLGVFLIPGLEFIPPAVATLLVGLLAFVQGANLLVFSRLMRKVKADTEQAELHVQLLQ